jgi:amidase
MTVATANGTNAANGIKTTNGGASWEQIGARKRQELLASIPEEWRIPLGLLPADTQDDVTSWPETCGWFTPAELAITNMTASALIPKLATGELSSEEVTRAFCKRAAAAHQLVQLSFCLSMVVLFCS